MTQSARSFALAPVLSITHHLPIEAAPHREILKHLTGIDFEGPLAASLYQQCCAQWLIEQHGELRAVVRPAMAESDYAGQDRWVDEVAQLLGTRTLEIAPMPPERLKPVDIFDHIAEAGALNKTYVIDSD